MSLKNKLSWFAASSLSLSFVATTVSCTRPTFNDGSDEVSSDVTSLNYPYEYNYQPGPTSTTVYNTNEYFHNFFGEPNMSYSAYEADQNGNPKFYGNKENLYCINPDVGNYKKRLWKNEQLNFQWVIVAKKELSKYKNLKASISVDGDQNGIDLGVTFTRFIKTYKNNKTTAHLFSDVQWSPDAIGYENEREDLASFDVYPLWINGTIGDNASPGDRNVTVKLDFTYDGVKQSIENKFGLTIVDRTLDITTDRLDADNYFGASANTYMGNGFKYFNYDPDAIEKVQSSPETDEVGPVDGSYTDFLSAENEPNLKEYLSPLDESNGFYLWGQGYHKMLIQWAMRLNKDAAGWSKDDYENYLDGNLPNGETKTSDEILRDPDWDFSFNFDGLDRYMQFAASTGQQVIGISTFDVGDFSFYYLQGGSATQGGQYRFASLDKKGLIDTGTGKPTKEGYAYLNTVHKKLIHDLSQHLKDIKDGKVGNKDDFVVKNDDGTKRKNNGEDQLVSITSMTDELNEESNLALEKNILENQVAGAPKIMTTVFMGWRSNLSFSDQEYLTNQIVNHYDQVIFHIRILDEKNAVNVRSVAMRRKARGAETFIYSTWDTYPGAYVSSDLSELYWHVLNTLSLQLNGYFRWGYDDIYSNWYDTGVMTGEDGETGPAGQSYLIYGGDSEHGVYYSTRMRAMIDAVEEGYKYKNLKNDNKIDTVALNRALTSIKYTNNYYASNDYKYDLEKLATTNFNFNDTSLNKSVSEQVLEFINYLDKL
jgi:hypothetical protein